ncbi:YncE family protein [Lichenifustis flavocetrariae]|uniref:YncE family protein n=1 Tax=Lichenifustis flavocetrariae TaxID=2949735 RepID=A0AA41Z5E3_9HYPH|nr:YncE family protein [Lichenifustis flavocetrariae]MCW6509597.1 YncE family protein [Lichenifustis flavocetrariae]
MRRLFLGVALAASACVGVGQLACAQAFQPADIGEWRRSREVAIPPANVYAHSTAGQLSAAVKGVPERVYVPNVASRDVYVIDPGTMKVIDHYGVGRGPQHIVPSWDLKTLWVTGSAESHSAWGSLASIDPQTGKVSRMLPMEDAYNMYFTPDGSAAIVVAESRRRLEFRDPQTMTMQNSLTIPECSGINHADFGADGRTAIFTCEFAGSLARIDIGERKLLGILKLSRGGMPQDIRISPDGRVFYVANMMTDGVSLIDADSFQEIGFIPTGPGAHGLYPSRDGTKLYVCNRGSHAVSGAPHGPGSVSVIDFATRKVEATWPVPDGGSPDMGNVSADGRHLWVSGRFDDVVYAFDTTTGAVTKIPVGHTPHGLTIWPQPGRYSLGHTGVMR